MNGNLRPVIILNIPNRILMISPGKASKWTITGKHRAIPVTTGLAGIAPGQCSLLHLKITINCLNLYVLLWAGSMMQMRPGSMERKLEKQMDGTLTDHT